MTTKARQIICISIAGIGLLIALAGLRMKVKDSESSGTMITWIGIGIVFSANFVNLFLARKSKS
jgi:phosphoglycerol transferase MdoB-like AlkP superfamily enzyme